MADAFGCCSDALQRAEVAAPEKNVPPEGLEERYEIEKTCEFIGRSRHTRVALQFPDELLVDAAAVAEEIEKRSGAAAFVLGDTSYGGCCVDEVAAEHARADCLVHYGAACLSCPAGRLPLMYVFEKRPVDLQRCASAFRDLYPDTRSHVVVLYDVSYAHAIHDFRALLTPEYPDLVVSTLLLDGPGQTQSRHQTAPGQIDDEVVCQFGRRFALRSALSVTDYAMFFIGQEGATFRNFTMTWNRCSFCSFDPSAMVPGSSQSTGITRALMKRYYAIERAKDASTVGILVGTLGVADYLSIIRQLKESVRRAGKKSYVFAVGKVNPAKLANFPEVDIYVLIACPENSLLDSAEFYKPVVTPFEMEVACNQRRRDWSQEYVTDFRRLLPGGPSHVAIEEEEEDECDVANVSLITGAIRTPWVAQPPRPPAASVVPRNPALTVADLGAAASFLAARSWRGLELHLGDTPVSKATQGRRGIAIAYEEEVTAVSIPSTKNTTENVCQLPLITDKN